jgi:hypothetical protein
VGCGGVVVGARGVGVEHLAGEACEGGGGAAGFDGGGGIEDALVEVAGGAFLVLAGGDALVALLEEFEGVEGVDDDGVFGEGEELGGSEAVLGDEVFDAEVEFEEVCEECLVGWRGGAHAQ